MRTSSRCLSFGISPVALSKCITSWTSSGGTKYQPESRWGPPLMMTRPSCASASTHPSIGFSSPARFLLGRTWSLCSWPLPTCYIDCIARPVPSHGCLLKTSSTWSSFLSTASRQLTRSGNLYSATWRDGSSMMPKTRPHLSNLHPTSTPPEGPLRHLGVFSPPKIEGVYRRSSSFSPHTNT